MPQNISDYTGFTTDYDAGVPTDSDDADIAKAIQRYHYGATYEGVGAPDGIEGHLRQLQSNIDSIIPDQTGNAGKVLATNGSTLEFQTPSGGGGFEAPSTWTMALVSPFNSISFTQTDGMYSTSGSVVYMSGWFWLSDATVLSSNPSSQVKIALPSGVSSNTVSSIFSATAQYKTFTHKPIACVMQGAYDELWLYADGAPLTYSGLSLTTGDALWVGVSGSIFTGA